MKKRTLQGRLWATRRSSRGLEHFSSVQLEKAASCPSFMGKKAYDDRSLELLF